MDPVTCDIACLQKSPETFLAHISIEENIKSDIIYGFCIVWFLWTFTFEKGDTSQHVFNCNCYFYNTCIYEEIMTQNVKCRIMIIGIMTSLAYQKDPGMFMYNIIIIVTEIVLDFAFEGWITR